MPAVRCALATSSLGGVTLNVFLSSRCSPLPSLATDVLLLVIAGLDLCDLRNVMLSCRALWTHDVLHATAAAAAAEFAVLDTLRSGIVARVPHLRPLVPDVRVAANGGVDACFDWSLNSTGCDMIDLSQMGLDAAEFQVLARTLVTWCARPVAAPAPLACGVTCSSSTILVLSVSGNAVGDFGATAVASLLPWLPSLVRLELDDCRIGDRGVCALARGFEAECAGSRDAGVLSTLLLGCNPMGDAGCAALAAALLCPRLLDRSRGRGLAVLSLGDTDVGDAGVEALARALDEGAMPRGMHLWLASVGALSQHTRERILRAASAREGLRVCW